MFLLNARLIRIYHFALPEDNRQNQPQVIADNSVYHHFYQESILGFAIILLLPILTSGVCGER